MTQSATAAALNLGRIGIWSMSPRFAPGEAGLDAAKEIEALGFSTLWIPGGVDDTVLAALDRLLAATTRLKLATGIINIWKHDPADLAAWWRDHSPEQQARLFLGLGVSHGPLIGEAWQKPLAKMRSFLDGLDAADMPRDRLCLAALGPKMLELAAERTAGAHPYMVTTQHSGIARKIMGPDALLAPEQGVVLESDPARAREMGREAVRHYARLPNYANNWRRGGFTDAEIENLDDRLIDALMACGGLDAVAARLKAHFDGGADHVCLQVISPPGDLAYEMAAWRELAKLL